MSQDHRLDLRLHAPCAGVVVVRITGALDEDAAAELREALRCQLTRATHVILDLADVCTLDRCAADALAEFDRSATRIGCRLHVTEVPDNRIRGELVSAGMAPASCPEAVVALLPPLTGRGLRPRPAAWNARAVDPARTAAPEDRDG